MLLNSNDDEWDFGDIHKWRPVEPIDIEAIFIMRAREMDDSPTFDNRSDYHVEYCALCLRAVATEELDGWYYIEDKLPPQYVHRECLEMDGLE